jgi:hypothetical protein
VAVENSSLGHVAIESVLGSDGFMEILVLLSGIFGIEKR